MLNCRAGSPDPAFSLRHPHARVTPRYILPEKHQFAPARRTRPSYCNDNCTRGPLSVAGVSFVRKSRSALMPCAMR